jgi:hypothetical protein
MHRDSCCANISVIMQTTLGKGSLHAMQLDLGNFSSIEQFSLELHGKYNHINSLVLNAGAVLDEGAASAEGLELSIASMHFGNAALVEWVQDLLINPIPESETNASADHAESNAVTTSKLHAPSKHSSRIVITGSTAYWMGGFHQSLMTSPDGSGDFRMEVTDNCMHAGPSKMFNCCPLMACPGTNGYARTKLANILYLQQLQKKLDQEAFAHYEGQRKQLENEGGDASSLAVTRRRVVTSSLHPGSVHTEIHPLLGSHLASYFLRAPEEAAHIVLHCLFSNNYVPAAYFDAMKRDHNLFEFDSEIREVVELHMAAHPIQLFADDMRHEPMDGLPKWIPRRIRLAVDGAPVPTNADAEVDPQPAQTLKMDPLDIFSFDQWFFRKYIANRMVFVADNKHSTASVIESTYPAAVVSRRLWDVTQRVVSDWKQGNRRGLLLGVTGAPKASGSPSSKRKDGLDSRYDDL